MSAFDVAVKEVRQVLASRRTAPEWRWNAYRRLATATAALAGPEGRAVIPSQRTAEDQGAAVQRRLGALAGDVLDRLDAPTIQRELEEVLLDLERLRQQSP